MLWAHSDQRKWWAQRVAFSAVVSLSFSASCFAQEPPLSVPLAGSLIGNPSSGCDAGLLAATSFYGTVTPTNAGAASPTASTPAGPSSTAAANSASDLNVPLYGGSNLPLYGNPLAGDNVPLYSEPNPGTNAPLYTTATANTYTGLYGGAHTRLSPVADAEPTACRSGIPLGEWLIYPSVRLYSLASDNLFLAPSGKISAVGFGETPSVTAQWTNGIHTTTIFANIDAQQYPNDSFINAFNRQATFTQQYSPLPDLTFTAVGNYSHVTVTNSFTSAIPSAVTTPVATPTRLPDGNIELPNGEIVSPTGQVVGSVNGPSGATGTAIVNPYDQYTGTVSVSKIFNRAILNLSGAWAQTDYQSVQNPGTSSAFTGYGTQTFSGNGSVWLDPTFYAYSNGVFSAHTNNGGLDPYTQAYRTEGGIGTRQIGLFKGSVYYGYQGSNSDTAGLAGGAVYGGRISYYPTLAGTITASVDTTINKASGGFTTLALAVDSPVQIPVTSSTRVTHSALQTTYQIAPLWTTVASLSYTQIDYFGSPRVDNAWQADAELSYDIWRNMTLSLEYEYTNITSNAPGNNATRNLIMMSALYHF